MDVKLTDLIYHKKNFLSPEQCDSLIQEYESRSSEHILEHCPEATTGADIYSSYKRIELIPGTDNFLAINNATESIIREYHDYTDKFDAFHIERRGSLKFSHMHRLLKYDTGTKLHAHVDHDQYVYGSCTFNLNDDYEGGDFLFFKGKHRVKLGKGDALIFPAGFHWVHEVDEIKSGTRYSTNSFLLSVPSTVFFATKKVWEEQMNLYNAIPELKDPTEYDIPWR
jgi:hypothetical protein|tara:strand:+ start:352 stop:1026 length:675 start_codon:yes stop_codon:yes gene_type:complete